MNPSSPNIPNPTDRAGRSLSLAAGVSMLLTACVAPPQGPEVDPGIQQDAVVTTMDIDMSSPTIIPPLTTERPILQVGAVESTTTTTNVDTTTTSQNEQHNSSSTLPETHNNNSENMSAEAYLFSENRQEKLQNTMNSVGSQLVERLLSGDLGGYVVIEDTPAVAGEGVDGKYVTLQHLREDGGSEHIIVVTALQNQDGTFDLEQPIRGVSVEIVGQGKNGEVANMINCWSLSGGDVTVERADIFSYDQPADLLSDQLIAADPQNTAANLNEFDDGIVSDLEAFVDSLT